ncbi:MAG: pyruvate, phosphate dikinase, partial [Cyclobacteriaceae bacterium]
DTDFGSSENPCLLSVRSGAKQSMPGMMDTVLDIGLNDEAVEGLAKLTGKEHFAWDAYRRLIQMYGDVVMKAEDEHGENPYETIIEQQKKKYGKKYDKDLTIDELKELVDLFKEATIKYTGKPFPQDPKDQIWGAINAVFESWNTPRAIHYREIHGISDAGGTAVNVQAMVYGNMGDTSASGVAFTRNAATGENVFNGEYLIDAQGEDVVAGIRTPLQITLRASRQWAEFAHVDEEERAKDYPSLEEYMPEIFTKLMNIRETLEEHFRVMHDVEFTIQEGRLWMLQTRTGKRTGSAMLKIAKDMLDEGLIDEKEALLRIDPEKINEVLHPVFEKGALAKAELLANGLPASPGAASGKIVFFQEDVFTYVEKNEPVILVRIETSADDLKGMYAANGILTARGGMTSHAAVVARGLGKCCISGAGALNIDYRNRSMTIGDRTFKEGEFISLDGSTGNVYSGNIETVEPAMTGEFEDIMNLANDHARLHIRANADTPDAAEVARKFGAVGIGLCRTEHMFFEGERIVAMREMILANDEAGRIKALDKLLPMQRSDFEGIFRAMKGHPVTIRLLDPPLHEFIPFERAEQEVVAQSLNVPVEEIAHKAEQLREVNPMLGHRGCRLGNTYPEITRMQTRAILEAALNISAEGLEVTPEIMVPLVGDYRELKEQRKIILNEAKTVFEEKNSSIKFSIGTMIEVPRAAVTADKIARYADFFSFGTNDLTQMTYGYSRDDMASFVPEYLRRGLLKNNPFNVIDPEGVGYLVKTAVDLGLKTNKELHLGICGEHGGDPSSIEFCDATGLDYVSCSPYRVPIARLAAAQANLKHSKQELLSA